MNRHWSPELRLKLVETLTEMPGADSENFFAAHDLGTAYRLPGARSSKKARILSALQSAEMRSNYEGLLEEAARYCNFLPGNPTPEATPVNFGEHSSSHTPPEAPEVTRGRDIFISHSTKDEILAREIKNFLVLGGVSGARIFFSSDRSTGIHTGENILERLQSTLAASTLVIEIISNNFLRSTYCLMELGGAWALRKTTFPVVVPPLTLHEAAAAIGNVRMGVLGSEEEVNDVVEELHEILTKLPNISLPLTQWNNSLRTFKRTLGHLQ
jgi:TIR domain